PTARAEALREPLRAALVALEQAIMSTSDFDPATARHTWRVAAFDYGEMTILLPALADLRAAAPGICLGVVQVAPAQVARKARSAAARAEALREPLRAALVALEQAIMSTSDFDPATARHTWRVAAFDYGEMTILLPALADLRAAAPGICLGVVQVAPAQVARKAEQGEIDLAFMTATEASPDLRRRRLFSDRYVLAGRADHPGLRRCPTLAQFCKLDHAIVSPEGGG